MAPSLALLVLSISIFHITDADRVSFSKMSNELYKSQAEPNYSPDSSLRKPESVKTRNYLQGCPADGCDNPYSSYKTFSNKDVMKFHKARYYNSRFNQNGRGDEVSSVHASNSHDTNGIYGNKYPNSELGRKGSYQNTNGKKRYVFDTMEEANEYFKTRNEDVNQVDRSANSKPRSSAIAGRNDNRNRYAFDSMEEADAYFENRNLNRDDLEAKKNEFSGNETRKNSNYLNTKGDDHQQKDNYSNSKETSAFNSKDESKKTLGTYSSTGRAKQNMFDSMEEYDKYMKNLYPSDFDP